MQDIIELQNKLVELQSYCESNEDSCDLYVLLRIRSLVDNLNNQVNEYDRYVDQMAFAHEQYEDRLVGA